MKAEGPQTAECEGAEFQNDDNAITIESRGSLRVVEPQGFVGASSVVYVVNV